MTARDDLNIRPLLQSLFTLRDTIDAVSCASELLPDDFDGDDDLHVGKLFKRLSELLRRDYANIHMSFAEVFAANGLSPEQ